MNFLGIFLLALALSMDAFAVSICKGITVKDMDLKKAAVVGLYFGGFQALMPFLGYILAGVFKKQMESFDHWVAFVLLLWIGIKMLLEAFDKDKKEDKNMCSVKFAVMIPLAIATSIDALAAGITLSIEGADIVQAIIMIGVVTFAFCTLGAKIGNFLGHKCQKLAEVAGGLILVWLGIKILLTHFGII